MHPPSPFLLNALWLLLVLAPCNPESFEGIAPLAALCNGTPPVLWVRKPAVTDTPDSDLLRGLIHERQHPPDCRAARLLLFPPAFGIMGMAATLLHLREGMLLAHAVGRTLVVPSDWLAEYVNPNVCPEKTLLCYLEDFGNCTPADAVEPPGEWGTALCSGERVVEAAPTLMGEGLLNLSLPSFPHRTRHWLLKEYTLFLLRPSPLLSAKVRANEAELGLTATPSGSNYMSVYIRSQKYRADFPPECSPTKDHTARYIAEFARDAQRRIVLLTADSGPLKEFLTTALQAANLTVVRIPDDRFPSLSLCKGLGAHHVHVALNCYQDRVNRTQQDEGLELLALFLLMARGHSFHSTECTTIRVLINELRWAGDGDPAPYRPLAPSQAELGRLRPNIRRLCHKCLRFYDHLTPLKRDRQWEALRYIRVDPQ